MLNPRGLALLALLFRAPESIAQSYSAPNCTRAECEVRAGVLEASFEVRPNGYNNMPSGCLLFEHDVSAAWGCWQVIYVEGCVGDACRSDDAECPCTIMDCGDTERPTVAPTTPSLASRAPSCSWACRRDTELEATRFAHGRGHRSTPALKPKRVCVLKWARQLRAHA